MRRRLFTILITLLLIASLLPASALAKGESDTGIFNWTKTSKENFYGARSHFVGLVFGDVSNVVDVEGKLAVGGNLTPTANGTSVNGGYLGTENNGSDDAALIVGGNILFPDNLTPTAETRLRVGVNGRAALGGTIDPNTYVETIRPGGVVGTYEKIIIGDFFTAGKAEFTSISNSYNALSPNGTLNYSTYSQDFQGADSSVKTIVYTTDKTDFNSLYFTIAEGQNVIVNFTASEVTFGNGGINVNNSASMPSETVDEYLRKYSTSITLNFPNATNINVASTSLYGVLLAPNATLTTTSGGGNIAGTLICQEIQGNGGGFELHLGFGGRSKNEVPSLIKKVEEKNDSTGDTSWGDIADYDIGDDVPFRLTGTTPSVSIFDEYTTYYYKFSDTLSNGLTFNNDAVVTLVRGSGPVYTFDKDEYTLTKSGQTFEIEFDDLKAGFGSGKTVKVQGGDQIVVNYTAKLNENAVIGGDGNPNEAKLKYSNKSDDTGYGETPKDVVVVFTFKIIANKVDEGGNALSGAGFTLYKWDASSANSDKWTAVGVEVKTGATFTFKGVDAGLYKLVETTIPSGYNKANDLEFEVKAVYDEANLKLDELQLWSTDNPPVQIDGSGKIFTATASSGTAETSIVNQSGITLPETGGIGTAIYYIAGLMLISAAAILLGKRRIQ